MPPLGASGVLQQLYRMQALAPQMLPQPMPLGQLNSNLPRLLVQNKSLLPAESPRAYTTSFASVWKSWCVRKRWTQYASPGDAPSQIAVALLS